MAARPLPNHRIRVARLPLVLGLALLLAACGGDAADKAAGGPPQGPPPVTVATPLRQTIVDWDEYVGRFEALKTVDIRPRVSGYLQSIHFRDGEMVRPGELLFVIDPRPYEARLAQARAQAERARAALGLARSELARSEKLVKAEAVSREEYDQRRATVDTAAADLAAAEADIRTAALDVEFTRVRSPIAGRVSNRRVDVGNLVTAGAGGRSATGSTTPDSSLLTTVVSIDPIYFVFDASEALYLKYQRQSQAGTRISSRVQANPVEIRLQDETDYQIKGRMDFVDNAIDVGTGTIRGRAIVSNLGGYLTPGLFGRMRLLGSGAYEAMLVPDGVILTDQTRQILLTVGDKNVITPKVVEVGPLINGLRVIRSGIAPGDRIVINGLQLAQIGKPVTPVPGKVVQPAPGEGVQEAAYSAPPASAATPVGQ